MAYTKKQLRGMSNKDLQSELDRKPSELEAAKKLDEHYKRDKSDSTFEIEKEIGQLIDEIERRKRLGLW